jgi:hypothetical protein
MSRALIVIGLLIALVGVLMAAGLPIGRLPGDVTVRRGNVTFYFPLTTSILASLLVTAVFMFLGRR